MKLWVDLWLKKMQTRLKVPNIYIIGLCFLKDHFYFFWISIWFPSCLQIMEKSVILIILCCFVSWIIALLVGFGSLFHVRYFNLCIFSFCLLLTQTLALTLAARVQNSIRNSNTSTNSSTSRSLWGLLYIDANQAPWNS